MIQYRWTLLILVVLLAVGSSLRMFHDQVYNGRNSGSDQQYHTHGNNQQYNQHVQQQQQYQNQQQNYDQLKANYIAKVERNAGRRCQWVDKSKFDSLVKFLKSAMGGAVQQYFSGMAVQQNGQKGLNYYKLSRDSYLHWLAIKIISGNNQQMYECSITLPPNLWREMVAASNKQVQRR